MDASVLIRRARLCSGLSLRALAARADTSHATVSAYESGSKQPRIDTLVRLLEAAGYMVDPHLVHRPDTGAGRVAKGHELEAVLSLAAEFPARYSRRLDAPIFGPRT